MTASIRHDCSAIKCYLQGWLKLFGTTVVVTQTSQNPHTINMPAVSPCWLQMEQPKVVRNVTLRCGLWFYFKRPPTVLLVRFPPLASMDLLLRKVGSWGLIQSVGYTTAQRRPALSAVCVSMYARLSRSQARDPHTGWDSAVFTLMVMYDN